MSYRDESALLARDLAHLAATGSSRTLIPRELDVALAGRSETLGLLRQVLGDTSGINRNDTGVLRWAGPGTRQRRSVEELEAHPVAVLSRTLATHPAPRPQDALSDVLANRPREDDPQAGSWAAVARHALLASHAWVTRSPAQLGPEQQWSAVADVAAIAQAVTVLDRHLYDAARTEPDVDPAVLQALQASLTSGLRSAAGEAARLAAAGPLPEWPDPQLEPTPIRVLIVRTPADVAAAQERIAAQVTAAGDLGPAAVTLVATGQARILSAAAVALQGTDPQRAVHAARLARQLAGAAAARRQLASLAPDDPRPVAQTREVVQHLAQVLTGSEEYRAAMAAVVDRSPAVVRALSTHADRSLAGGRWLVVDTEARLANDPLWRRATRDDPEPRLCVSLSAAAAAAIAIPAPPAAPRAPAAPPPWQTLSGVLSADQPVRPARPAQRLDIGTSRE